MTHRYDLPNFGHLCYSWSIMMDLIAFGKCRQNVRFPFFYRRAEKRSGSGKSNPKETVKPVRSPVKT